MTGQPGDIGSLEHQISKNYFRKQAEDDARRTLAARATPGRGTYVFLFVVGVLFFGFASLLFSGVLLGQLPLIRTVLSVVPREFWMLAPGVEFSSADQAVGYWAVTGALLTAVFAGLTVVRFLANRSLVDSPLLRIAAVLALTILRTCAVMLGIGLFIVTAAVIDRTFPGTPGGDLLADPTLTVIVVVVAVVVVSLASTMRSLAWRDRRDGVA